MLIPLRTDEPTRTLPVITVLLIVINVAVFMTVWVYGKASPVGDADQLTLKYGAIPYEMVHGLDPRVQVRIPWYSVDLPPRFPYSHYLSLLTYMFMHGGFVHIIGNMLFLNTFGPNLEDAIGHFKFLLFYLLCGVVSAVVYVIPNFNSAVPLVGASGAIAGVMGAHLRILPGTRILCLLFFVLRITLPAIVILFPWIVLQFFNAATNVESNVAWIAHIGGFIFGMLLVRRFQTQSLNRRY